MKIVSPSGLPKSASSQQSKAANEFRGYQNPAARESIKISSEVRAAQYPLIDLEIKTIHSCEHLKQAERGALIFTDLLIERADEGTSKYSGGSFDEDSLRGSLLLFDRLDYPTNNMLLIGDKSPPGLEKWAGYQSTRVECVGGFPFNALPMVVKSVYDELNCQSNGQWVLTQNMAERFLPAGTLSPQTGLQIKLINALPIPDRSVPYEEVLNFKARHRSELISLRHHIDDLVIEVAQNGYGGFAETVAFEKFEKSIQDYSEAARQANFLKRMFSLDVSYSLSDGLKAALATATTLSVTAGLSIPAIVGSAAVVATAAGVKFSIVSAPKKKPEGVSPFEYIWKAHDEF